MIGILIGWLIAGVLLVVFSGLLYYNNIITLLGFFVILLLGIAILLSNVILLISARQMESGKAYGEMLKALKRSFLILLFLSIIISGLGLFSYLLNVLDMYELDSVSTTTLSFMLIVGLLSTVGSFISWRFAEIGILTAISNASSVQDRNLDNIKRDIEYNRTTIESKIGKLNESIEKAGRIEERAKEELER